MNGQQKVKVGERYKIKSNIGIEGSNRWYSEKSINANLLSPRILVEGEAFTVVEEKFPSCANVVGHPFAFDERCKNIIEKYKDRDEIVIKKHCNIKFKSKKPPDAWACGKMHRDPARYLCKFEDNITLWMWGPRIQTHTVPVTRLENTIDRMVLKTC